MLRTKKKNQNNVPNQTYQTRRTKPNITNQSNKEKAPKIYSDYILDNVNNVSQSK